MSARMAIALATCVIALTGTTAASTPTPVPGGANQVSGLSGKVGQTLFNGVLRVQVKELRNATAADHPERLLPSEGQKVMIMTVLLKNGSHGDFIDLIEYTLADADGVTFKIPTNMVSPSNLDIQQAGAARQTALFTVDSSYKPTKVIVQCTSCSASLKFKALRFAVP